MVCMHGSAFRCGTVRSMSRCLRLAVWTCWRVWEQKVCVELYLFGSLTGALRRSIWMGALAARCVLTIRVTLRRFAALKLEILVNSGKVDWSVDVLWRPGEHSRCTVKDLCHPIRRTVIEIFVANDAWLPEEKTSLRCLPHLGKIRKGLFKSGLGTVIIIGLSILMIRVLDFLWSNLTIHVQILDLMHMLAFCLSLF